MAKGGSRSDESEVAGESHVCGIRNLFSSPEQTTRSNARGSGTETIRHRRAAIGFTRFRVAEEIERKLPALGSTSMESPVRIERRTPGSARGSRKLPAVTQGKRRLPTPQPPAEPLRSADVVLCAGGRGRAAPGPRHHSARAARRRRVPDRERPLRLLCGCDGIPDAHP